MDSMQAIYIEEAGELLSNLEGALLTLETNIADTKCVEEIFRIMHTLKGNSSMFGLQTIAEFVHDLETIYDKVRNKEMALNKDLLNCSLLCLDHLKVIIHDPELSTEHNKNQHTKLINLISSFISVSDTPVPNKDAAEENQSVNTFYILFEPGRTIFLNGTNPLFIVNELATLGKAIVIPHFRITEPDNEPTECFTYWEIILKTNLDANAIRDVFMFVEDSSTIKIEKLSIELDINDPETENILKKEVYNDMKLNLALLAASLEQNQFHSGKTTTEIHSDLKNSDKGNENGLASAIKANQKEKSITRIKVSSEKLDELMNLVSELVTTQAALTLFSNKSKIVELDPISENVEKLSRRLRDIAFGMTLVPINNMFGRFQRLVRDVSTALGKEVDFITEGGETELDKSIIDTLTDPLMHILRNSLDHGIEKPEQRLLNGKPRTGKLVLKAFYSGVFIYIQIIDDGKGIDPEVIRRKAVSKGIIGEDQVLSESEIFDLIFYPGFSTAEKITDVSGRGVGMDVVKRNVTSLKGTIKVESRVNEGTTLTVKLPLTLSIIDGLLVTIEKVNYIIPLSAITKCFFVTNSEMINNFNNLLYLDQEHVPFINMRTQFGYNFDSNGTSQVIVVNNGGAKIGLSVDTIIGEYQAVVKPLGKYYKNQDFISGGSILGDGTIALVLDANKLIDLNTKLKQQ